MPHSTPMHLKLTHSYQKGVVLIVALIALLLLSLSSLPLVRMLNSTNTISGNTAFSLATQQQVDLGMAQAHTVLQNILTSNNQSVATLQYSPTQLAVGVPSINWANVPCYTLAVGSTNLVAGNANFCANLNPNPSGYVIRFYIDRQCNFGALAPTTTPSTQYCVFKQTWINPLKYGDPVLPGAPLVIYRATVYVLGPRNTSATSQATFAY